MPRGVNDLKPEVSEPDHVTFPNKDVGFRKRIEIISPERRHIPGTMIAIEFIPVEDNLRMSIPFDVWHSSDMIEVGMRTNNVLRNESFLS